MRSMVRSMVGVVFAGLVMSVAATGSAQPQEKASGARPSVGLAPALRVTAFRRPAGETGAYTGGSLAVAFEVENTAFVGMDNVVVKMSANGKTWEGLEPISIPAHTTRTIVVVDKDGLESSCAPTTYSVTVSALGVNAVARNAKLTPSCTFSSSIEETWNKMTPDHVEAEKNGNAFLKSPALTSAATCAKPSPTIKVHLQNNSAKSSPSMVVQATDAGGNRKVKAQTTAAFPLASGEDKEVLLTPYASAGSEPAERMSLGIVDWTKSLGGHTSNGGIFVNTKRSCSLAYSLE